MFVCSVYVLGCPVSNCMCDHRNTERGPMFQKESTGK
jgi:hypothetical protein